ncbi:MAG: hypothetical protein ACRD2C_04235 [Acidimicrobiales bacterium]
MTAAGFLAAAIVAGVVGLVVAWLVAAQLPPAAPRPADHARALDPAWPPSPLSVSGAYRAAIGRARQQSTAQLLATHHAARDLPAPTVDELLEWAAAHHVLVAERGITPLTAKTPGVAR